MSRNLHPDALALERVIENDLPPAERRAVETHLRGCGRCRREVDRARALFRELDRLPIPEPPPGFDLRILAAVLPRPTETALLWRWARRAYGLAATVTVTAGLATGLQLGPERTLAGLGSGISRFLAGAIDGLGSAVSGTVGMVKAAGELVPVADTASILIRSTETTARALDPQVHVVLALTMTLAALTLVWASRPRRARRGVPHVSLSL